MVTSSGETSAGNERVSRIILKLGSSTIFDTGNWKTSGNSQNGDPDRFIIHFSPGESTTFEFFEGASNSSLGATQLSQLVVNPAPLGEQTLRMIGETSNLFSAQAHFTP
ncbi:MAG: hypothetical protein OSB47_09770, partial [Pirellulaceae bacterium]|nr:hypothetical protein [Pirellulaceae bacterium]